MNNLQYVVANSTRAAMHMAVELCEEGSFDSVTEAFGWLVQERDDTTLGDGEYESRMDELLCRLTNGKWSKSRSYSVDFMVSCVDEAYEDAELGDGREAELVRAINDVLRNASDAVWVGDTETLVDRMVAIGVYGHEVYEGACPWEPDSMLPGGESTEREVI